MDERLISDRFPRASGYDPEWVLAGVSGAANPLWITEWLAEALDLRPGMRVLDLGCGRALSSVFLRREFGVQVWASDLWFSASENLQRIRDAGVEDIAPDNATEIRALNADSGRHLGYVRVVGRRRADAQLTDPIVSVPTQYRKTPLLRHGHVWGV